MSRRVDLGQVVPIKGQDYFTTAEIEQIESETKEQVKTELDFDNTISGIEQEISDLNTNKASKTELESETSARELADTNLQGQIDAITSSKDVVDIVGTYQDLMNYDTTSLTEDDVIKVLDDSTHNDAMSYYRWSNNTWNYVGSEGPFYTKSETDSLLNTKQPTIDSTHKLSSDLVDDTNQTNKFTSTNEKNTWNAKYDKPNTGIPKSDLVASVQESLNKADTAIQDVSDKEDKSNKVTEINSSSTDTQYPSAKCVYDSQEEQNEHIAELEMLYNAFPTVSAEDTTIQLDNTAKVKFREIDLKGNTSQVVIPAESGTNVNSTSISISDVDTDKEHYFELDGNTYQYSTTGKNLFNKIDYRDVTLGTNGSPSNVTKTSNSISYLSNSSLNFSGVYITIENIENYVDNYDSDTTYCISADITVDKACRFGSFQTTTDYADIPVGTTRFSVYSKVLNTINFYVRTAVTGGVNVKIENIMVANTNDSDYEPYTNGASPNPTYPQNIEVVTGENDITICGKNLFDKSLFETFTTSIKYIEMTLKPNTTYTMSSNIPTQSNNTDNANLFFMLDGQSASSSTNGIKPNQPRTQTTDATGKVKIGYRDFQNEYTDEANTYWYMLEQGSTATTYEAYTGTTYPINIGNIELCKIDTYKDRIYKSNNKWYLEKNIGKVVLDGSENWTSAIASDGKRWICTSYDNALIPPDMNTIGKIISDTFMAISANSTASSINGIAIAASGRFVIYDETTKNYSYTSEFKTWISTHNTNVYYVLATPTTTEITDSTLVSQLNALYNATIYPITNINTETSNLLPYIDLHYNFVTPSPSPSRPSVVNVVKGNNTITISNSDNTESQVFPINLGDMELCKIGTYQDYIYENNGNWFKKENIGKTTLNGTEDWTLTNNVLQSTNEMPSDIRAIGATMSAYSSHFEYHYYATSITTNIQSGEFGWNSGKKLTFKIDGFTTEQEYTNWLGNNNVSIYYQLATPTDTQITDTTLITQLNNIKKAYSYDTQTNISQTNTDKPFIIYAEAIRSLKDVFE